MGTLRVTAPKKLVAATDYDPDKLNQLKESFIKNIKQLALRNAEQNVGALLTMFPGLRPKGGTIALNGLVSIREGMQSNEITSEQAKEEAISVRVKFMQALNKFMAEGTEQGTLKKKGDKPKEEQKVEVEDATNSLEVSSIEDFKQEINDQLAQAAGDTLAVYNKNSRQLRADLLKNNFVIGYAPVMVINTTPLSAEKLRGFGFRVVDLEGYPILESQLVVGIRHSGMIEDMEEKMASSAPKGANVEQAMKKQMAAISKKMKDEEKESEEQMIAIVKSIRKKDNLVESDTTFHWAGATWYWLMPAGHIRLLQKSTIVNGTAAFKPRSWGLPFKA